MTINNLVILGPTATGKTSLSLKLSEYIDSEIINSDSSIFYKDLEVGTGKLDSCFLSFIPKIYILIKFFQPVSLLKKFNIFLKSFGSGALKLIHFFFIGCENSNV